jgi:dihydrofolate reductase
MKIILVFVTTLDGKITKWGNQNVKVWSSPEDQQYFANLMKKNRLIVMGSNTYNAEPIHTLPNRQIVVLTRYPEKYKNHEVPDRLSFVNKLPSELATNFRKSGYEQMLVVGGPHIATSFLKEQLIDEVWITVEPLIFGTGGNFVTEEKLDIKLKLLNVEKVNDQGTFITKYTVLKNIQ